MQRSRSTLPRPRVLLTLIVSVTKPLKRAIQSFKIKIQYYKRVTIANVLSLLLRLFFISHLCINFI